MASNRFYVNDEQACLLAELKIIKFVLTVEKISLYFLKFKNERRKLFKSLFIEEINFYQGSLDSILS